MEPVTNALASVALGRCGLNRISRHAVPMLLVAGMAADLDWTSYLLGARPFLLWHRTALHSLPAALLISFVVAGVFWLSGRRKDADRRIFFWPALAVCAAGAVGHVLLDLTNDTGVALLWPFSTQRFALDLSPEVDPLLLAILLAGVLIPSLLKLIGDEIASRRRSQTGVGGAAFAICLALAYLGARTVAHQRADALLNAHTYREESPIRTGTFPTASLLRWRGVAETQSAMHQVEVSVIPGMGFDPRTAITSFKPAESEVLRLAGASDAVRAFLAAARFPLARVQPLEDGSEVQIYDLRDPRSTSAMVAVVKVNSRNEITQNDLQFITDRRR
jgi:membrane-bound metal-dependent hydrolase YbcI (DUF457 family)